MCAALDITLTSRRTGCVATTSADVTDQTVYRVLDVGAGGTGNSTTGDYNYYDLTEVGFTLGSQFAGQTLTQAAITSNGYETLILGATVTSAAVPEPSAWAMIFAGVGMIGGMTRLGRRSRGSAISAA